MYSFNRLVILLITFLFIQIHKLEAQCGDVYTGEGTFYGYGGGGNCSFPDPDLPAITGAMNQLQYDTAAICGACVSVSGPIGTITIRIEDRCPECAYGDIDLAEDAFPYIANVVDGRVPISWHIVACPVNGPIQFYFKEGSSQWWTAVQVRNHKYPIQRFEYKSGTEWIEVERMMYNYFLVESGMGLGPFDFRITDIWGHVIEENGVVFAETTVIEGTQQFPDCTTGDEVYQDIELTVGWNLIQLNINPFNADISNLFPNAVVVKQNDGYFKKGQENFLNTFNTLQAGEAYVLYNSIAEHVTLSGTVYEPKMNTLLEKGWNLVAYPLQSVKTIDEIFTPLSDTILSIKNFDGFWVPENNFNSIENLVPGEVYFIQTTIECAVSW